MQTNNKQKWQKEREKKVFDKCASLNKFQLFKLRHISHFDKTRRQNQVLVRSAFAISSSETQFHVHSENRLHWQLNAHLVLLAHAYRFPNENWYVICIFDRFSVHFFYILILLFLNNETPATSFLLIVLVSMCKSLFFLFCTT